MDVAIERTFKTKTGSCRITPTRIILERKGAQGKAAGQIYGKGIQRALIIYSLLGAMFAMMGAWCLTKHFYLGGTFYCLIGVVLIWNTFISRNNSATGSIDRSMIQAVENHPPHPPLTRGYFVIWFLDNGRKCRRLIMLPGSMSRGNEEYLRALQTMQESGLLPE